MYLALMAQGAISVNELMDLPVPLRQRYSKIIQDWHKQVMKMYQQMMKSGQFKCPFFGK